MNTHWYYSDILYMNMQSDNNILSCVLRLINIIIVDNISIA